MGTFKDKRNFVAHTLNSTTFTVDGEHKLEGIDAVEIEYDEDEYTTSTAGDGMAVFVDNPIRTGKIKITMIEPSPSNSFMWGLQEERRDFSFTAQDANVDSFRINAPACRVMKSPIIKREKDISRVEWTLVCTYLEGRSGTYKAA